MAKTHSFAVTGPISNNDQYLVLCCCRVHGDFRPRRSAEAKQYHDEALSVLRRRGRTKGLANALLAAGSSRKEAVDLRAARALVRGADAKETLGLCLRRKIRGPD